MPGWVFSVSAALPLAGLTVGVMLLQPPGGPPHRSEADLAAFRPVLLACAAQMRADHPGDAALRVDMNALGMSRQVMRAGQTRWEVDGTLERRGERTSFDCTAVGVGPGLTVISVTSPLWWTPPPS